MAVPKKRTSKQKKNSRRATWIQKANKQALKAFSLASSIAKKK
jgi:large subunit ribosomal protein L32|nr:ribosomal protein L32 [Meringosphaera mediterranea]WLD06229.1 ribosomal protein L32 [Meringosphaera mediterranea]